MTLAHTFHSLYPLTQVERITVENASSGQCLLGRGLCPRPLPSWGRGEPFLPHMPLGALCVSLTWRARPCRNVSCLPCGPAFPRTIETSGLMSGPETFRSQAGMGAGDWEGSEGTHQSQVPWGPPGGVGVTSYMGKESMGLFQEKTFLLEVRLGRRPCHPLSSSGVFGAGSHTHLCAHRHSYCVLTAALDSPPEKFLRLEHGT